MNIGYVRVSTIEQNEERQIVALQKYSIEKWFKEKISAKSMNRPKLKEMLEFAREGDTIYITDFSRIARSTKDLLNIIETLQGKNIRLISDKENIDTNTTTGKLMITVIGAINEFERENLLERQREGIAIAKKAGKYKGRKPVNISMADFVFEYNKYKNRQISKVTMAQNLNISRPTLDKLIKKYKETPEYRYNGIHPDTDLAKGFQKVGDIFAKAMS